MSTTGRARRGRREVGFNAMQPGKIKRGDILMLLAAIVVIVALVAWALQ